MDKLLLKTINKRRIFLVGCISESDMNDKAYLIKKLMKEQEKDVEVIYKGKAEAVKPYVAERVVDTQPIIEKRYSGGKYRNYTNLNQQSNLNAKASLNTAVQQFSNQFGYTIDYILIVQV